MAKKEDFALLGDVPVKESDRGDLLKFSAYAKVLARSAIETQDSITIGVFGKWGTGKTSLMRLMKEEVDRDKEAVAVWFNAWQYEKEEHLIVPLTATISKQLANRTWSEAMKDGAKSLREALRAIAYGFSIKGKVGIPLLSEAEVNLSPKNMIERYQDLTKDSVLERSLYFDAFEMLDQCAGHKAPRIVVFVDDLDRCFPPKAVELLEGIKLVLNQPGFSFVLGVNDTIIQAFIRSKYAKDYNIEGSLFEDYLDKIVQVKVPVPEREPGDMTDYIRTLLQQGKVFPVESIKDLVPLIAEACKRNPRSIIRLLNRIMVTVRIGELEEKDYDPVALLLHIAMDEPKYRRFREALDRFVIVSDKEVQIGAFLADCMDEPSGDRMTCLAALDEFQVKGMESEFKAAVGVLENNEHIYRLLRLENGRKWLSNPEFRNSLGQASESTLGEKQESKAGQGKLIVDSSDPIRQLQENMVQIPAGVFNMGSDRKNNEQPIHSVELNKFSLSRTPVTQAQYQAVMGRNPSKFEGDDRPIECASWEDAMKFCEQLSKRTGQEFTLPSEAQWEYACRAGSNGQYCFGDDDKLLGEYAWYGENSGNKTQAVGKKKPNPWGLYDMHGNVWEWCLDRWHGNYEGAPSDGSAWIEKDEVGSGRVIRGGSWSNPAGYCRCSCRHGGDPDGRGSNLGFRVALVPSS